MTLERQLALVDRVLGLEAELAERSAVSSLTPADQLSVEERLDRLQRSPSWRIGRLMTSPFRAVNRVRNSRRGHHE
ncbi:hypothetical protein [Luethyella okanaganae]|uniref:Uncharacterized protein n=1 Tax=Luethyella okanaganae TaxID=69372 RepID=A0ABW1VE02_9MICO